MYVNYLETCVIKVKVFTSNPKLDRATVHKRFALIRLGQRLHGSYRLDYSVLLD